MAELASDPRQDAAGPREVFERLIGGINGRQWDRLADLYAEDAVVEHPFALPRPARLDGRQAIRRHFAAGSRLPLELRARDIVVHETTDPEVIIGEYVYDGLVTTTGRTFTISNVQVMRVRGGLIVTSRDYHNHAALAELAAGLTAPGGRPGP
ncbi:MAG TPA: nuclear transport factor 2 family protein [Streptosporangiaceae bacterium]